VKFLRNNEVTPMSLSGFSKNFITLVPGIFSLILGILIVLILSPITSELSKYYETVKTKYSANENLIIMSDTGIWIKENKNDNTNIIRADIVLNLKIMNL
jgi:lipopolysaccharide export LptBFGC system permease protein LptF